MEPVFKDLSRLQQPGQMGRPIGGHPAPEDVMVRPLDHRDGVDLDITEVLDRPQRAGHATAEGLGTGQPLPVQGQSAAGGDQG